MALNNKEKLIVEMYGNPSIDVREVLPNDDKNTINNKNKKPFIARKKAILKIAYIDKNDILFTTAFSNPVNYEFDGATIPFRIGKGNMKLLVPALWHDIICEKKDKIGYHRHLSSLVFRELLLQCGVNKLVAQIMYLAVDNFQKTQKEWRLNNIKIRGGDV